MSLKSESLCGRTGLVCRTEVKRGAAELGSTGLQEQKGECATVEKAVYEK